MKSKIIIFIIFSFLFADSLYSQWVPIGPPGDRSVSSLTISGNNIFAGTDSGVYLSTNNGQNWTQAGLNNL